MGSGQATSTKADRHVCKPPPGFAPEHGLLWICPDCWSEFIFRPVWSWELGRVINLWVRHYEPGNWQWVPPERRFKDKRPKR